ncbi:MAG: type I DNA topoisomerase [Nitrospirota bacterium]
MEKSLVIVESPAKARTISKYLGKDYIIKASIGHVKDLPGNRLGVDIDNGFRPEYVIIKGKNKVISEIKKIGKKVDRIYLAPDPDREGEAIAWHIAEELNGNQKNIYRVLFNEITKRGIKRAMESPGKIDVKKVDAQQARRILDRIVGYKISPLLWEKVRRGLSAGRVQSIAVRFICEREREIEKFVSEEYWSITADLQAKKPPLLKAKLYRIDDREHKIENESQSNQIVEELKNKEFIVSKIEKKDKKRYPVPPFITSRLQQEAARKLKFTPKKTMMVAQQLYEGLEIGREGLAGLITYMRTDSTRVSSDAVKEAREYISSNLGKEYLPGKAVVYKSKKDAQDAHEAIRPTSVFKTPDSIKEYLQKDQYNLYKLIWNRFVASQINPALLELTSIDIKAGRYLFRATGTIVKFPGFTILYIEGIDDEKKERETKKKSSTVGEEEDILPLLEEGERLKLVKLSPKQHFTQPPFRYNEALLIRELEEKGIGRPSTYASIVSTIQERKYVEKREARFYPTDLGKIVNDLLVKHFPDLLNAQFTARMEDQLDGIEEGKKKWVETVGDFYGNFDKRLKKAHNEMKNIKREEIPTNLSCEKCGKTMVKKWGKNGKFLACSGYPDCKNTKEYIEEPNGEIKIVKKENTTNEVCEKCGKLMVVKTGRFGRFLACSGYPGCRHTKAINTGVKCPSDGCNGDITEKTTKRGKVFYACSKYPECNFASWDKPVPTPCPDCSAPFLVEKFNRQDSSIFLQCRDKECGYKKV